MCNKLNEEISDYQNYLKFQVDDSMYLKLVSAGEVFETICKFKNKSNLDTKISALKISNESSPNSYNFLQLQQRNVRKFAKNG